MGRFFPIGNFDSGFHGNRFPCNRLQPFDRGRAPDAASGTQYGVRSVGAAAFLAGATSLALEIVLVRMLAFFLATSLDFLAIPLALLGLSIGSMATHLFWRGSRSSLTSLAAVALFPVLAASLALFFHA